MRRENCLDTWMPLSAVWKASFLLHLIAGLTLLEYADLHCVENHLGEKNQDQYGAEHRNGAFLPAAVSGFLWIIFNMFVSCLPQPVTRVLSRYSRYAH